MRDKKWKCPICQCKLALSSRTSHQQICKKKPNNDEESSSESSDSETEENHEIAKTSTTTQTSELWMDSAQNSRQSTQSTQNLEVQTEPFHSPKKFADSEVQTVDDIVDNVENDELNSSPYMPSLNDPDSMTNMNPVDFCLTRKRPYSESEPPKSDSDSDLLAEEGFTEDLLKTAEYEHDEAGTSSKKRSNLTVVGSEAKETSSSDSESQMGSENLEVSGINQNITGSTGNMIQKWWKKIPESTYIENSQLEGKKIFLKNDSPEFILAVKAKYEEHEKLKLELDKEMTLREINERQYQFSDLRDKPFLDEYEKYVQNFSKKDALGVFSAEYDDNSLKKGTSAQTARNYRNRVMELRHFYSKKYEDFHMDWFTDFGQTITKKTDGNETSEIFLPTKNDLTEFVRSYKYGLNPAANVGLRIFALKKLLDFISMNISENENKFQGTLLERNQTVDILTRKLKKLHQDICPDGTIKNLTIASNKNHRMKEAERLRRNPEKTVKNIMSRVAEYLVSEEFTRQKVLLFELAYDKKRTVKSRDYTSLTAWVLEQLICIGGNRPCAILGITNRDWLQRKQGYCPFNQSEKNELTPDTEKDPRKVLKNPYSKPVDSDEENPTGVIVESHEDKISVGPPAYLWFSKELEDLVNAHSMMAIKLLKNIDGIDLYGPKTKLFLKSNGSPWKSICLQHFKDYTGLHMIPYDFRKSLSTFCLESSDEKLRKSEASVLRHSEETVWAYYFQKHSDNVQYVSIQYAKEHNLVRAKDGDLDKYLLELKTNAKTEALGINKKREISNVEYQEEIEAKQKEKIKKVKVKTGRNWLLRSEYDDFMEGFRTAMKLEDQKKESGENPGPFHQLLKYRPGHDGAGCFPSKSFFYRDFMRVLFGLEGEEGDKMRQAELSVYNGVPFLENCGRKKIEEFKKPNECSYKVVSGYWYDRIKEESKALTKGKSFPLEFIFSKKDFDYYNNCQK